MFFLTRFVFVLLNILTMNKIYSLDTSQNIVWTKCPVELKNPNFQFECGEIAVPRDWKKVDAKKIRLSFLKISSLKKVKEKKVLFVNP